MINDMDKYNDTFKSLLIDIEDFLEANTPLGEPGLLYDPVRYVLSGKGKRIRPLLALLSCGAVGGNPSKAIPAGAAIEIMHNFTLVHDDIMDESPLRRGRETVHLKWSESIAILSGDVMVGVAYRLLEHYGNHPNGMNIYKTLTHGLIEVCEGQVYDMMNNTKKNVSHDDYITTITKKTAKILETSCLIGAYAGEGKPEQLNALANYAINLGIAFQIQDDLLDLMADESEFGKHIGQDIIEGKKTWLMIEGKQRAKAERDINLMNRFFEENGLTEEFVPAIREFLIQSNTITDAENLASDYFEKSRKELEVLEPNHYKDMLNWLVEKLSQRKY
jgi:geranylgeranyl diphosphate synthase type II